MTPWLNNGRPAPGSSCFARRVQAHSLGADQQQVVRWATHHMTMEGTASGRTWLVSGCHQRSFESLAARVRPSLLQRDPIRYGKVLTAIGYLLDPEAHATAAATLDQLRKTWKQVNPNNRQPRAYRHSRPLRHARTTPPRPPPRIPALIQQEVDAMSPAWKRLGTLIRAELEH